MSRRTLVLVLTVALLGCGSDDTDGANDSSGGNASGGSGGGASGSGGSSGGSGGQTTGGAAGDIGYSPGVPPSGWTGIDQGGIDNPGGKCTGKPGEVPMKLPVTGIEYCLKAHPDCSAPGTGCPLYVTINTQGALFDRVDDPATNGKVIVTELYTETDGDGIKDKLAELPRVIAHDFPGLDRDRVYAIGWSAGAGAVRRGLCHASKKSDHSELGTTSDIYAAVVALGGCGCADDYIPLARNWHIITWNGMEDEFNGGDACEAGLRERAIISGCETSTSAWVPVQPTDPYAKNADGSTNAERLSFGACAGGDVIGYRFRDEGHVVSAKEHFDPKISGYDTVWNFLQGRTKGTNGVTGTD